VLALVGLLVGLHGWRVLAQASAAPFALTAADLPGRRWAAFVTHIFTHANWPHVLMNAAFCLVFGAPVARLFGSRPAGGLLFFAFFLSSGVAAALGYTLLYPHGEWMLVGASGAASGLMGAAARLLERRGRPGPILSRPVLAMTLGWIIANAALGLSGLTPGAGGMPVAWQAHILGFFAGLLLIGPFAWAAAALRDRAMSTGLDRRRL